MKDNLEKLAYLDLHIPNNLKRSAENKTLIAGLLHWDTCMNQVLLIRERNDLIKRCVELLTVLSF